MPESPPRPPGSDRVKALKPGSRKPWQGLPAQCGRAGPSPWGAVMAPVCQGSLAFYMHSGTASRKVSAVGLRCPTLLPRALERLLTGKQDANPGGPMAGLHCEVLVTCFGRTRNIW